MDQTPKDLMTKDGRIETGITRGQRLEVKINGKRVPAYEGETIGAVLAATGIRRIRRSPHGRGPRGLYCCVGACHGCLVTVDGRANVRACVTQVRPGQQITLQDGLGRFDMSLDGPLPGRLIRKSVPVVVIGGGPAGLCAAIAAARSGAQVLVIDENAQPGGQIYRQLPATFQVNNPATLGADYADGQSLLKQAAGLSDGITVWNDALVWSVFDSRQLAVARKDELVMLDAKAIVAATGAYERPVPVPGWTLPGVMTAGGAQVLLKSQGVRPGYRVLMAGTGPLQWVVANQMVDAGMEVVAMAESASACGVWWQLPDLLRQPGLLKQGLKYLYRLKRAGVSILRSYVLQAIEGGKQVQRAVLSEVDPQCRPNPVSAKSFDVDTVCLGYGLIPSAWLTNLLGCRHLYNQMVGGWVPCFDQNMQTDQHGVFVAGDGAGVGGVLVARMEGTLAGLFAAVHAGTISPKQAEGTARPLRKQLIALGKFRLAIDRIYQIYPDLYANIKDETIVCRCEGITAGEIRKAIGEGTTDLNDIKKRTRMGMGYCQGANCTPVVASILAREFDVRPEEIKVITTRPPARPIPLNLLMYDVESEF